MPLTVSVFLKNVMLSVTSGLKHLLYGDDNLDYETNVAIVLAVHNIIKHSERF